MHACRNLALLHAGPCRHAARPAMLTCHHQVAVVDSCVGPGDALHPLLLSPPCPTPPCRFYDEGWRVFNSLNVLELKSLEEPRYLLGEFAKQPLACLTLASFLITNTGGGRRAAAAVGLAHTNMR